LHARAGVSWRVALVGNGLVKVYRGRAVVDGVDVEIHEGEVVGLLGPNGAGKTTTFYILTGFLKPDSGAVTLEGKDVSRWAMYRRARAGIGYLPQEPSIFRRLNVADNVRAIVELQGGSRKDKATRVQELLGELDIAHLAKNKGYELSGGERRRVEITRALVTHPKFMLLDEPFAGIDPIAVEDIQKVISRLKQKGLGILITDHNVRETLSICDRAYIMCEGRILKSGSAQYLADDPEARKIYLGEKFRLN
jgi:lipopolysaccharide export system ATP-binding protein